MESALKRAAKDFLHRVFRLGQRFGVDILPRHFYSEIPDLRKLARTTAWKQPYSLKGVAGSEIESQSAFLKSLLPLQLVHKLNLENVHELACQRNGQGGFGTIESDCLFAFIYSLKPPRIVQIGCGVSTAVCLMASQQAGYTPQIVCIEPYPNSFLKSEAAAGTIQLIESPVEEMPADHVVAGLSDGDLFFVDSSHSLGPAGEASRIILELLPRLSKGCFAHFHDIYFPYDYRMDLLASDLFFSHESALLHAFLAFNSRFQMLVAMSHLHHANQGVLHALFPKYRPCVNDHGLMISPGHYPSSIYLKVSG